MTLAEQLYDMMQKNREATQPTDLVTGTVTSADPLAITIDTAMAPLPREVLYLTESVIEKKIPVLTHNHTTGGLSHTHSVTGLGHSHTVNGDTTSTDLSGTYETQSSLSGGVYPSSEALSDIAAVENGATLPVEDGYIILNRGLSTGDKVLLLRVQQGQKFVVLSRIFE